MHEYTDSADYEEEVRLQIITVGLKLDRDYLSRRESFLCPNSTLFPLQSSFLFSCSLLNQAKRHYLMKADSVT